MKSNIFWLDDKWREEKVVKGKQLKLVKETYKVLFYPMVGINWWIIIFTKSLITMTLVLLPNCQVSSTLACRW